MPIINRRLDLWLPTYAMTAAARALAKRRRRQQLTHVMLLVCDHFEPRHGIRSEDQPRSRMQAWASGYAALQDRCRSAFGHVPKHTWFYPPHHGSEHLSGLASMAHAGLGEVELHYHHDGDTYDSLKADLSASIGEFQSWGLLLESGEPPRTAFGFVHGDWALCNSGHGRYCGVNDELTLLQELGCWGDFTMPSGNRCQTRKINSIYYGKSSPVRPKGHDQGADARVGAPHPEGLWMMQGPLAINWGAPGHPRPENASLTSHNWGRPDRIPVWLDCNVHVQGRPDWLFVKLHTHGAIERDFDALFGEKAFELHRQLNEHYNDGERFRLHYVTAREAYNIAKAAEDGLDGDPSRFLDHRIAPPLTRHYWLDARHRAIHATAQRVRLDGIAAAASPALRTRVGPVSHVGGRFAAVDIDAAAASVRIQPTPEFGEITIEPASHVSLRGISGAETVGDASARPIRIRPRGDEVVLSFGASQAV